MIQIITGWGNPGGSSVALLNLCNALNSSGIKCILYAPHDWILSKCKSEKIISNRLKIESDDTMIFHFWRLEKRPPVKKVILSSHEQNIFPIQSINYKIFDAIHYVSEHQRQYHNVNHPYFIIPNILDDLKANPKPSKKIAGIIGSVDRNKQVHLSIQRALADGFEDIRLFGAVTDLEYWKSLVAPIVDGVKVKYMGVVEDKQKIYDQITDVYHSSILETWGYIKPECQMTNTIFHGNSSSDAAEIIDKGKIVDMWRKELDL